LVEDEQLFRESCRSFAEGRIKPLVRKMDEEAKLDHSVIPELFDLGLMGIHVPDKFGGAAGSFFMSVLAVEEISRVDASFGVFIEFANVKPEDGYKGITAFLIERDFPGFTVGQKEDKLAIRASSTCELLLEDCRVPKENVLGEIGKGYKIAIETLNEGRIGIGAQMIGLARGAWQFDCQDEGAESHRDHLRPDPNADQKNQRLKFNHP